MASNQKAKDNPAQVSAGAEGGTFIHPAEPKKAHGERSRSMSRLKRMTNGHPPILTMGDVFSGCGGLAWGFRMAGFESKFAVDIDPASCNTYERNFGHPVFCGDIAHVVAVPKVDVLIGGPPCQGFSPLGKMSSGKHALARHTKLNKLWQEYLRILDAAAPRAFVVENVPQFLNSREFALFREEAAERGFRLVRGVLNAHHYGVAQLRRRAVVIGAKGTDPSLPLPVDHRATVRDAIGDLPLDPIGKDWHIGRNPTKKSITRYRCVPPGGNRFDLMRKRPDLTPACWLNKPTGSTDVFGRLRWDEPALTIRTEFFKPEKGCYLHPEAQRPITHREAARLQTFPDEFEFVGSKIEVARMIGNAVPPLLAYNVALALRRVLLGEERTPTRRQATLLAVASHR